MRGGSERELVAQLKRTFSSGRRARGVLVGIGDDAAVLAVRRGRLVWTVDTSVENVHFRREWLTLGDVGWRSLQAAASDIAAMGGSPLAALSNLIVPASMGAAAVRAIAHGQARAAEELRCPVIGGNLSRGGELSVTTTVLGHAETPLLRTGARPSDELWLIGEVGLARAGFLWLSRKGRQPNANRDAQRRRAILRCVDAWRRPKALIREAARLRRRAHAAIDISDGLSTDAEHLAVESGVRVVIEERRLRAALGRNLVAAADFLGVRALELAIAGGEDYALLATGPSGSCPRGARRIGRVEKGRGVWLEGNGRTRHVRNGGFDHFKER